MTRIRRRLLIGLAVLVTATIGVLAPVQPASAVFTSPDYAFFFTPHQDDEVLSMGAAIKAMTDVGRPVYVVLLTDGGSSQYCNNVNYPQWRPRSACVAARDGEFTNGVQSMGAIPIIRSDRAIDGTLTVAYAQGVINAYHTNYPNAALRGMSQYDASPDHANIGIALNNLRLYTQSNWLVKYSERITKTACAYSAKYDQNTTLNYYVFGHVSVPTDFSHATYPEGNFSCAYSH